MHRLFFFLVGCLRAEVATAELLALRYVESAEAPYQRTNLALEQAHTEIICAERGATIDCRVEARYVLQNYTEETEAIVLALATPGYTGQMTLKEGQEDLLRDLTEAEQDALRILTRPWRSPGSLFGEPPGAIMPVRGASLRVAPGQHREVVFQGKLSPQNPLFWSGHSTRQLTPALQSRHLVLSKKWEDELSFAMSFEDLTCWPVVGAVSLVVEVPSRWALSDDAEMPAVETQEDQDTQRHLFGLKSNPKTNFTLSFYARAPRLQGGGVLLGLGGSFSAESAFVFRVGYEAGNSRGLLASLSAETNFRSRVALIPQLGVGTPWLDTFPSLGLLLGAPLLLEQGQPLSVGFRTQFDVTYGAIGLSMPIDVYPARTVEARLQASLLAHFSF